MSEFGSYDFVNNGGLRDGQNVQFTTKQKATNIDLFFNFSSK
jgi:hypothetical protein